ncbi:TPA: PTS sugar transporter subunit IIA, partial [Enterococcus faecium]
MTNEIILMSHGLMAEEILNSAKMILGNQINYPVVSMTQNDGIEGTINKLNKILEETSDIRNIIILVDLMGGTPANVAMMKASMDKRIQVVTGMNLGMVLESYFKINEEKLAEHLIEIGKSSIKIPEIQMDG